jgi:hypothetical protein
MVNRETLLAGLRKVSELLAEKGVVGEIDIFGGAAMMLAFQARQSTKDVDAVFAPVPEIREAAARAASEFDMAPDWLNDAAKGFLSPRGDFTDEYVPQFPNLRILTPTPQYLLAMKVLASRVGVRVSGGDKADIQFLIRLVGLTRSEQVMEIVAQYYDPARVPIRSAYLVDEIFQEQERES